MSKGKANKKVLITGGAGYIGSVLVKTLLDEGFEVLAVDNLMYRQNSLAHLFHYKNFSFAKEDVTNFSKMKNFIKNKDIIIPLAAIVGAPACDKNPSLAKFLASVR